MMMVLNHRAEAPKHEDLVYEEHSWSYEELNRHFKIEIAEATPGKYPGLTKQEAAK